MKTEFFYGHEAASALHRDVARASQTPVDQAIRVLCFWCDRSRQRRVLAGMEAHRLHDIGKTRAEAQGEARKRFWQA